MEEDADAEVEALEDEVPDEDGEGVVDRGDDPDLAEQVLLRVAEREPENTKVMSNRALVLRDLGRHAEADALVRQLDRLEPHPPFS